MSEIRFSRERPWCCPAFRDFYIQDRPAGRDIYRKETYEYALFRKIRFEPVKRFRTRKKAYVYLCNKTGLCELSVKWQSPQIIVNNRQYIGVTDGKTMYRLDKRTRWVEKRPVEDERLTCWYPSYSDCLTEAKRIVAERTQGISFQNK